MDTTSRAGNGTSGTTQGGEEMTILIVRHHVRDLQTWKPVFDGAPELSFLETT